MKTLLLSAGVATGLAAAVLDGAAKGAILLLVATLVVATLRRASAATRHLLWTAAIICALLIPALSLLLPHWRVLPGWMAPPSPMSEAAPIRTRLSPRWEPAPRHQQAGLREQTSSSFEPTFFPFFPPASRIDDPATITFSGKQRPRIALSPGGLLLAGWAIGAALLLLPILRSAFSLHRLARRSQIVRSGPLAENLAAVAGELKLRRNVALHVGAPDAMPMVWGVWHAHLLLPSSAEFWPGARLRAVLLHELAHLRRHDPLIMLLGHAARAAHWFNPLAWLALHRLRVEQERACDDYVLRAGIKPSEYADDVLDIATALQVGAATDSIALSMAASSRLERRLRSIVGAALNRNALTRSAIAITLIASVAIALPLAMLRAADEKRDAHIATPAGATPPSIEPRGEQLKKDSDPSSPAYRFEHALIILSSAGSNRHLSLDTGRTSATAPENAPTVYLLDDPKEGWVVRVANAYNYHTTREDGTKLWNSMTAEAISEPAGLAAAPPELNGWYPLRPGTFPITVLIPQYGLVHVTGFDERTKSAVLEYKRVVTPDVTPPDTTPSNPRATVNEWLNHVGANRIDEMWALTTRESGMDTSVKDLDQFASIRARHALLGESAAMVVSTRFNDDAARPRALLFSLIRQGNHWRIRDVIQDSPENVQHRVEGFATYPGVRFHVLPAEIAGDWTSGFLSRARHTFHLDGTGEVRDPGSSEPRRFRWELNGDLLRMRAGEHVTEGKIVRIDHDLFAVRYPDGNQWGFHRAKTTEPRGTSDGN